MPGHGSNELNKRLFKLEFQKIINYTDQDPEHREQLKKLDTPLCRYKDIFPYEYNVIDISTPNKFVNASFMHVLSLNHFIASQGPKDNTIDDFWTMCFEKKVPRILMLCNELEGNKKNVVIIGIKI